MRVRLLLKLGTIFILVIAGSSLYAQWTPVEESLRTPFRKGRWITALGGSISSSTRGGNPRAATISSNEYRLELSADRFIRDRWSVGLAFQANRDNTEQLIESDAEGFFVGPSSTYYFMKSPAGSVYASLAVGYFRQRTLTEISQLGVTIEESLNAEGVGVIPKLAYAFVVKDDIVFNIGLSLISTWFNGEVIALPSGEKRNEDFYSGSIAFQFGFSVLL